MNRIKVLFASLGIIVAMHAVSHGFFPLPGGEGAQVPQGMIFSTVYSSAQVVAGGRGGIFYAAFSSTGDGKTDWYQVFDTMTNISQGNFAINSFQTSTQSVSAQTFFLNQVISSQPISGIVDYRPYGVVFTTGIYVYLSPSGNQLRHVTVLWGRY